jgi:hypothetical protein
MNRILLSLIAVFVPLAAWGIPEPEDFYVREEFPAPGFGWVGFAQRTNNLFLVYNGDTVFRQVANQRSVLEPIGSGYAGDPGFIAVNTTGNRAVLGGGANGLIYFFDLDNPQDFVPGEAVDIGPHFSGAMLNDNILAIDRGDFGIPSEIVLFDLSGARAFAPFPVLTRSEPASGRDVVIEKPAGSFSASLAINRNGSLLYVTDAGNGEIRSFSVNALINAFNAMQTVDWESGTLLGQAFDYPLGGVYGFTTGGNAVIAGFGSIVTVNVSNGEIVSEFDPAGTMPFYTMIYNPFTEEFIAIEAAFPNPDVIYATKGGLRPRRPCDLPEAARDQYAALTADFSLDPDLDADGIPDDAMLELIIQFSCQSIDNKVLDATALAYDENYRRLESEPGFATLEPYRDALAALLTMNASMQTALKSVPGLPITLSYAIPGCSEKDRCLPAFGTGAAEFIPNPGEVFDELFIAEGDPDFDTFTNGTEYSNITAIGGSISDFAISATSPELDGTGGVQGGASSSGCFIATAAFGTPLHPEIDRLRAFRDDVLLRTPSGTAFVEAYYRFSPPVAEQIAEYETMRALVRGAIYALLFAIAHPVVCLLAFVGIVNLAFYRLSRRRQLARAPGDGGV